MARYTTGGAWTQDSLMTAIDGILVAEGWTQDELNTTTNEAGWHKGNIFIQAGWNDTTTINLYQSTAFINTSTPPGSHTGDSGSDHIVRAVGNAGVNYYAFTDAGAGGPTFAYFVVEYATGFYRHFGFGDIVKHGNWTGGSFCFGHQWGQGSEIDNPEDGAHSILFDGMLNASPEAATIKIVGSEWPNAPASSVWGVSHTSGTIGNDTAGNGRYRCLGGVRKSPYAQQFGRIDSSGSSAFIAASPVPILAHDPNFTAPYHVMWMGELPSIYVGSMLNFNATDEISIGSETWKVFPMVNEAFSVGSGLEQSGNGGVWYRKV